LILDLINFDGQVVGADLVVTGEGSLDERSRPARRPLGVARAAAKAGVRVVAVAGRLQLSRERLQQAGISAAYALSDLEPDTARSIANAPSLLRRLGRQIAKDWLT
jgi:glycerate kinase